MLHGYCKVTQKLKWYDLKMADLYNWAAPSVSGMYILNDDAGAFK